MLRYRSALYREAGVRDLAKMVLNYLWSWVYKAGITKKQLLNWFRGILRCDLPVATADLIPTELRNAIMKLMAGQGWNCGDFMQALEIEIEKPVSGYRWKSDKFGRHVLVKVKSDVGERAVVRGKRFVNDIFIGLWWTAKEPRVSSNRKLQNQVKKFGSIFWNDKLPDGGRQYGAFVIVPRGQASSVADTLCSLAADVDLDGGEHRLSAISMQGIAEHREVRDSDQIWAGCIRSIKFNWKYSLPDLLNGRIEEFRKSPVYSDLISKIRER